MAVSAPVLATYTLAVPNKYKQTFGYRGGTSIMADGTLSTDLVSTSSKVRWEMGWDWLTAAQVAELAGFSTSNLSAQPNKWKKEGQIFAIRHQGLDYFPAYGLDAEAGYRPLKPLAPVLALFGDAKDGWGLAYWFASANSFLGGKRPQDVLLKSPDRVLAAAADEMAEVAHG